MRNLLQSFLICVVLIGCFFAHAAMKKGGDERNHPHKRFHTDHDAKALLHKEEDKVFKITYIEGAAGHQFVGINLNPESEI